MARIPKLTSVPAGLKRQSRYGEQESGGAERQNLTNLMRNLGDSKLELENDSVVGGVTVASGGRMQSGATAYNTGTGWWIGNDAGTPKLFIGTSAGNKLTWDGTVLNIVGSITLDGALVLTTGNAVRSGQTAYDTGTGFYLGNDAGIPKLSIGNSAGAKMTWDGTTLTVTYADGTAIETLKPADAAATAGATWGTDVASRPAELTDGRVDAALTATTGVVKADKVETASVANSAVTATKTSPHMSASASPALQSANVLTWAYDGVSMIDISIAAGSKKAGATTASWGSGTETVANADATWAVYAVFGNGIGSAATSFGATTTLSDATAGATRVPLGTVAVTAGGSGTGSGGGQIEP